MSFLQIYQHPLFLMSRRTQTPVFAMLALTGRFKKMRLLPKRAGVIFTHEKSG